MSQPLIEIKNLKKYFSTPKGDLHAVDDVSLTIEKGKTLGIVGESGCGKSTLGSTVIRLNEATSGEVLFNGENIFAKNRKQMKSIRREMQMIFQDPYSSLNSRLTIGEIIAEPLIVNKVYKTIEEQDEKVRELMETVGLADRLINSYPHELDGGRRQRIGVARALALDPQFIVCDEPVSALDVSIQAQILNLLMDLQKQKGLTYMFVTHDLSVVKHISDEIAVMYLGKCVERATSKELFGNPMHPYTKALLSAIPVISVREEDKFANLIKGEVTSPINPPVGCRFASRCDFCTKECHDADIPLIEIAPQHFVACRLCEA